MKIHKEGRVLLSSMFAGLALINLFFWYFLPENTVLSIAVLIGSLLIFLFFLQFFRAPDRVSVAREGQVVCPSDGKVVVIEETIENEVLQTRCIQVSVFMSPLNVHINWFPVSGIVDFVKYHPGKFLVAWHPKSSTENERTTVVVKTESGHRVLFRQIAGAVARRIVWYAREGQAADQAAQFGFIKFGSRVDVFLPLGSDIKVKIGDKVKGVETIIAELPR